MKYAIIKTGGKQYQVSEGRTLEVERLKTPSKEKVEFNEVLLVVDNESVTLGQPLVLGGKVIGEVLEQIKGPKIRVAKFKAKARYRRVTGHRQSLSKVKIEKIFSGKEKQAIKEDIKVNEKKAVKKAVRKSPSVKSQIINPS